MDAFIGVLGFFIFGLSIIFWAFNAIRKKGTRIFKIGVLLGVVLFVSGVFMSNSEPALESSPATSNQAMPRVESSIIEMTVNQMKQDPLVKDAYISVEGDRITLALQVNAATSEDKAKELGENFARLLASLSGAGAPTKEYLGGLWDSYTLQIGVGTGPDNFIVQGAKVPTGKTIKW